MSDDGRTGDHAGRLAAIGELAIHDLREPIRKIRQFTERVARRESYGLEERSVEDLRIVTEAAARLEELADRIRALARPENGNS